MKKFIIVDTKEVPYSCDTNTTTYKVILFGEDGALYEEQIDLNYRNYYERNMTVEYSEDYAQNNLTYIRKTLFNPEIDNIRWLLKEKDDLGIKRGRFMDQLKKLIKTYFISRDKMFNEESLASIAADLAEKIYLGVDNGN